MRRPSIGTLLLYASTTALLLGIAALAGCGRSANVTRPTNETPTTAVRPSSGAMLAAIAAQDRATPELLGLRGVVGTGTSSDAAGRPVVMVYAEREGVSGIPSRVGGYPVRVLVTGKVVAYSKPIQPHVKPGGGTLQMGTSTGNDLECAAGTLSCVVVKGGADYFLSNNHVFARENAASIGERIDAPGRYDGHPICAQTPACGTLADFRNINFGGNNVIDAAITRPSAGLNYTSVEAGGYDPTSTVVTGTVGMAVKKTGRTSRLTHGTIDAVNVTIQVQYSAGIATFTGQYQMPGNFIRSGDSGSLMVTETGNDPVGLCFAGGSGASFANPIGPVLQAFSATVK